MSFDENDLFDEPDPYGLEQISYNGDENESNVGDQNGSSSYTTTAAIDEEVTINVRSRVSVKLDEDKLVGDRGIPYLRRKVKKLQFKKKNYEYRDLSKLLEFYKLWTHKLYPRATFKDFIQISEKVGKTAKMKMYRRQWIEEDKQNDQNIMDQYSRLAPLLHETGQQSDRGANVDDNVLPTFTGKFTGFKLSSSQPPEDNGLFIPSIGLRDAQDELEDDNAEASLTDSIISKTSKIGSQRLVVDADDDYDNENSASISALSITIPVRSNHVADISPFEVDNDVPDMDDLIGLDEELREVNNIRPTAAKLSTSPIHYPDEDNDEDQLMMDLEDPTIYSERAQVQPVVQRKPVNQSPLAKQALPVETVDNDFDDFDEEMDVLRDLGF